MLISDKKKAKYSRLEGINGHFKKHRWSVRIIFRKISLGTISLPLGGFIFSVFWALYVDFEGATYTHCGVQNYLPSISAAIGNFGFSQSVWRICIALHAAPRSVFVTLYYNYLHSIIFFRLSSLVKFAVLFHVIENFGLIFLTFVSSSENYWVHEKSFIMFMLCSEVYMLLMCILLSKYRNIPPSPLEKKSLRFKMVLFVVNLVSFLLAVYAFIRHNNHCETGMYTIFALMEYIVVLTNMGFHLTAYWDFYDRTVIIGSEGLKFLNHDKNY